MLELAAWNKSSLLQKNILQNSTNITIDNDNYISKQFQMLLKCQAEGLGCRDLVV
jgi:hypothetical protein